MRAPPTSDLNLVVRLLGNLQIMRGPTLIELDGARLQSLLAYLILNRGTPQPRQHLAFMLWPDSPESQARTNLRNLLHKLSLHLPDLDDLIQKTGQSLVWRLDAPALLDIVELETILAGESTLDSLDRACQLYRGNLLPSCYDDWIAPERERLHAAFERFLEKGITRLEAQQDYRNSIRFVSHLLQLDPVQESHHQRLMTLHALVGDRSSALKQYGVCVQALEQALGVSPGAETQALYKRLQQNEGTPVPRDAKPALAPLVGRTTEWSRMVSVWQAASTRSARILVLQGEVGIGKSRLIAELSAYARQLGVSVAQATCHRMEGQLPFSAVIQLVRTSPVRTLAPLWRQEIARLLPEFGSEHTTAAPFTETSQRHRLFDALTRAVLSAPPRLIVIDDLQWCDRDSIEWLHFMLRQGANSPILLVLGLQTLPLPPDSPLQVLLQTLHRYSRVEDLVLMPLDKVATGALAAQLLGEPPTREHLEALFAETGGNPLGVVETLQRSQATAGGMTSRPVERRITGEHALTGAPTPAPVSAPTPAPVSAPAREASPEISSRTPAELRANTRLVAPSEPMAPGPAVPPPAGLPSEKPAAARSRLPLRHRLPNAPAVFVGREREVAFLRAAFQRGPVTMICGPGGVGKTALVLKTIPALEGFDLERTLWIDLRPGPPAEDPHLQIIRVLARAQGLERLDWSDVMRDEESVGGTLIDLAESGGWWVVLDDFHNIEPAAATELLTLLLRYARKSHWLVTCRKAPTMPELVPQALVLGGLADDQLRQLAGAFTSALTETGLAEALASSGGSPWVLQQLLTEGGEARQDDPMLGGLPEAALGFLEALSTVDRAFPLDVLRVLTPLPVQDVLTLLQRRGLIQYSYEGYRLHDVVRRILRTAQERGRLLPSPITTARLLCTQREPEALLEGARILLNAGLVEEVGQMLDRHGELLIDDGNAPRLWQLLEPWSSPRLFHWRLRCLVVLERVPALAQLPIPALADDPALQLLWSRALLLRGQPREALLLARAVFEARRRQSSQALSFEAGMLAAECLYSNAEYQEAAALFAALLPPDARAEDVRDSWVANSLIMAGQVAQALARIERVLPGAGMSTAPMQKAVALNVARVMCYVGRYQEAYVASKSVVSSMLPTERGLINHLTIALEMGRYEEAGQTLQRLVAFRRNVSVPGWKELGLTLHYQLEIGALGSFDAMLEQGKQEMYPAGDAIINYLIHLEICYRMVRAETPRDLLTMMIAEDGNLSRRMLNLLTRRWRTRAGEPLPPGFASPDSEHAGLSTLVFYPLLINQIRAEAALVAGQPLEALAYCGAVRQDTQQHWHGGADLEIRQLECDILLMLHEWQGLAKAATELVGLASDMGSARFVNEGRFFLAIKGAQSLDRAAIETLAGQVDVAPIASRRARVLLGETALLDAVDRRVLTALPEFSPVPRSERFPVH